MGASGIPLNYRRYSYIQRVTKLVFHLVHTHNMSSDMGESDMSSDLIFWWTAMACIHKSRYTVAAPTVCISYTAGPDPPVDANAVPSLRIVVSLGWFPTVGDASGYARSYGTVLVVRFRWHA